MATCIGKNFNDELTCALCLDSWRQPVECVPCAHIYCRSCLPKTAKTCPLCRGQITSVKAPHRTLVNLCEKVTVECQGCQWVGTREQSYTHVCPQKKTASPSPAAAAGAAGKNTESGNVASTAGFMARYGIVGDEYGLMDMIDSSGNYDFAPAQTTTAGPITFDPWKKYDMSREEYQDFVDLFKAFDEDKTGALNFSEVFKLCRVLNYARTPAEVARIFVAMDTDSDNVISQDELLTWMSQHRPDPQQVYGLSAEEYREAFKTFNRFDRDGDGWVNVKDFGSMCRANRVASSDAEVRSLFQNLDKDGNGLINLDDYLRTFQFREL